MTRKEFLQGLKEALDGNMDASAIQENLNYYNEYINEEVRKGKTEQQVRIGKAPRTALLHRPDGRRTSPCFSIHRAFLLTDAADAL